jgi:transaldolase
MFANARHYRWAVDGETGISAASLRSVESIAILAEAGLNTFTFSPDIARMMFDEPLTARAAAEFKEAAARGS